MWLLLASLGLAQEVSVTSTDTPVEIDGVLDEAVWAVAEPVTDFLQYEPSPGGPPPGVTEVRFAQDDRYLYVGMQVREADYRIRARVTQRERINDDDQIGLHIDTFADERSGYLFYFNPHGIQQDVRTSNGEWSISWDTAFRTKGRVTEDGYVIEAAFPWRSLKYPSGGEPQDWGIIVTRKVPSLDTKYAWPVVERRHPRQFSQAAKLKNVQPAPRGSGLELIPTATAIQQWPNEDDEMSGLDAPLEILRPSIDARLGLTPDISLTTALNPDFSQVESDVADVRLNPRFAFQFRETRPLFLDGSEYYQDRSETLYTRSINNPVYGIKLSGREGPFSIGMLNALDRSPMPSFNSQPTAGFEEADTEGRVAQTTMLRTRLDAFGTGFVGFSFADKRLLGEADDPSSVGPGVFDAVAADTVVNLGGRWLAGGSSQHTFVGPQGGPTLWGMANEIGLERSPGSGTGLELMVRDTTPTHRLETGFSPLSGATTIEALVDQTIPTNSFAELIAPGAEAEVIVERDGDRLAVYGPALLVEFAKVHEIEVKGGPVDQVEQGVAVPGAWFEGRYEGDLAGYVELEPEVTWTRAIDYTLLVPAEELVVSTQITVRPVPPIQLDLRGSWGRFDPDIPGPEGLPETALLFRPRLNWQFTRELGLRVVSQLTEEPDEALMRNSILLTWLQTPGTAAYLGVSQTTDRRNDLLVDRAIFAKASVLLRP